MDFWSQVPSAGALKQAQVTLNLLEWSTTEYYFWRFSILLILLTSMEIFRIESDEDQRLLLAVCSEKPSDDCICHLFPTGTAAGNGYKSVNWGLQVSWLLALAASDVLFFPIGSMMTPS
eukprot:GHVS01099916.1.p1 GENE.GHVS01099916.1~~GHVS01099916.1.p1  ORF type:complete len:119 (+),score=9.49 GHVS01099916.1:561-917(+)